MNFPNHGLRADLRDNEVATVITAPAGAAAVRIYSPLDLWARLGGDNAELPDSNQVSDGSASFPLQGGVAHSFGVSGGDRLSFVTERAAGRLFIAFST